MTSDLEVGLYIFLLAGFLGYHVISRVPPLLRRRSRIGSAKAAVLPVPVCAMPQRSRPARIGGIACAWIGVGVA